MNVHRPFSQAVWDQTPAAVQDDLDALEVRGAAVESTVQRLEATVQHLTAHVQQTSQNSSRPPSSAPPQAAGKPSRREPSGRRPGGQPGHEGHPRALVPVEEVDVVVPVKPARCHHCQHPWQGEAPQPQRQQVTEIPPVKPVVTEYQRHRLICPVCGAATRAE
jgi:transposase